MKGLIETIKGTIIIYTLGFFSYIIPKKKDSYAFVSYFDRKKFSGNLKSLLLYIKKNHPNKETIYIGNNKNAIKEVENYDIKVAHKTLNSFWAVLRAEHIFIDASRLFFSFGRFSVIQLWHGTGFKKVALVKKRISRSTRYYLEKASHKYKFIVSSSESDARKIGASFKTKNVAITGIPRNDRLYDWKKNALEASKKYNLNEYDKIIT